MKIRTIFHSYMENKVLYLTIVLISMFAISLVNCLLLTNIYNFTVLEVLLTVIFAVVAVIIVDAILAFIVRWILPKNWFGVSCDIFVPSKKFRNFYEKLGVKKWKEKVLDLGKLSGFKKNKIVDPKNNEYIGRYILEANYGIAVHISNIIGGFIICFLQPLYSFNIYLPVAIVNALLNYMSYMVLRYNLPKLKTLYKYNERFSLSSNN